MGHANALYLAASEPSQPLDDLVEAGVKLRETLASDAAALAQRGFVDGERLHELKGAVGFKNIASDLLTLASMLRAAWPTIAGKCATQESELTQAEILGDRLITAIGIREQSPIIVADAADNRQRAYTLLSTAYDHARRAITFLRWKRGDVDEIVPSLYAGRGGPGKKKPQSTTPQTDMPLVTPADAVASPTTPGAAPRDEPAEIGMPNSNPFMNN